MKGSGLLLMMLGAALFVALFSGCKPGHTPTVGGTVSCTSEAVASNWARAYPEVQACLTVLAVNPIECLDAVPSLVKVGIDVVACIVRSTGQEAGAQYQANPSDKVSGRKAERAEQWLETRGFVFQ